MTATQLTTSLALAILPAITLGGLLWAVLWAVGRRG